MPINKPKAGEFSWNRLITTDMKKAKQFYSDLFGWETFESDLEGVTYTTFTLDNKNVGGLSQTPDEATNQQPQWLSYVTVDNINISVYNAEKLGATIAIPPTSIGSRGYVAIIIDPCGASIGLWQKLDEVD